MIESAVTDLPADSPTSPSVRPRGIASETLLTALTVPSSVSKQVSRRSTVIRGSHEQLSVVGCQLSVVAMLAWHDLCRRYV